MNDPFGSSANLDAIYGCGTSKNGGNLSNPSLFSHWPGATLPGSSLGEAVPLQSSTVPSRALIGGNTAPTPAIHPDVPPPLPPRPVNSTSLNQLQSLTAVNNSGGYMGGNGLMGTSTYSPYGGGSYGLGGGYGGYGGYGSSFMGGGYSSGMMGGYSGYGGGAYNQFGGGPNPMMGQLAEEQSRQAFSSLEAFIQTFSSISMMLESSLNAVYMSFRAALGLADQFSRLKAHFQHIFATLTLIRMLRWLWQRLMVLVRLRSASSLPNWNESVWQESSSLGSLPSGPGASHFSGKPSGGSGANWAMMALTAIALGGPYVIWKLASKLVSQAQEKVAWATAQGSHYKGVALYPFNATSQTELSLMPGDQMIIAPKENQPQMKGWLLASKGGESGQSPRIGIVPSNYIKVFPGTSSLGEKSGT